MEMHQVNVMAQGQETAKSVRNGSFRTDGGSKWSTTPTTAEDCEDSKGHSV